MPRERYKIAAARTIVEPNAVLEVASALRSTRATVSFQQPPIALIDKIGDFLPVSAIVLITITGQDAPGISRDIAQVLAVHDVQILDIAQSVIHESLNLGVLIQMPEGEASTPVIKDILFRTHESGLQASFRPIRDEEYEQWVRMQGQVRHSITVLGESFTSSQFAKISGIIAHHGANIDRISRLSGRISLVSPPARRRACVEFSIRGALASSESLRSDLFDAALSLGIDIAFQVDNIYRRNRRMVAFDMDSTLIQTEVIDELAALQGVGPQVQAITASAMNGEIDFSESLRKRVSLLAGLSEKALEQVASSLPLTEGVERLMSSLRSLGYKTAVLSGGFDYFGNYLQRRLGIDYVVANRLEIADGKLTGRVVGRIVDGPHKSESLQELAAREGFALEQVIAIGDGANDLPMLAVAGLGIAFHAKPKVRETARHAISNYGLDGVLYLMGMRDRDIADLAQRDLGQDI